MNFRRLASALITASLLAGCGASSTAAATSSAAAASEPAAAENSEVLRVGMECNYAPFNWSTDTANDTTQPLDGGGYCDGYDVVIAEKMAEATGRTLEVHKLDWDNLILNLQNNEIDAIIAGMTATDERKEVVNFTSPYYESEEVMIVRKDSPYASVSSIQDFSGATVQGQMNTIYDEVIDQIDGVNHAQAASDFPAAIQALTTGAIDGVVSELPVANGVVSANPDLSIVRFAEGQGFVADTTVSIAVRKDDGELQQQLEDALSNISTDERNDLMQAAVERQPANE